MKSILRTRSLGSFGDAKGEDSRPLKLFGRPLDVGERIILVAVQLFDGLLGQVDPELIDGLLLLDVGGILKVFGLDPALPS